jgi:hypothetical protein
LIKNGFHVKTDFTKISSLRINNDSEMLKPVRQFVLALEKIAAASEICEGIQKRIDLFNGLIKGAIKNA